MGLFSKFGKNKQESTEDSGYYRAADDRNLAERARAKRAAHAGAEAAAARGRSRSGREVPDPVLPEKKRARRRLVGAIALALAVAIGLPMVLDSEPKPLANDIAIQIPAREKTAEDDKGAAVTAENEADKVADKAADKVAQNEALDQSEEIVEPAEAAPKVALAKVEPNEPVVWTEPKETKPEPKITEPRPEPKPEPKHDVKPERKAEPKPEAKAETRRAEAKPEVKPDPKPEPKREAKPEQKPDDAARALAILEGKAAAKPAEPEGSSRYVIQVAALSAKDKVDELQGKLQAAGIKSFTQKSPSGELTRVKVGPFGSREEAEKARARLQKIGLSGSLVPV
ncbi:SPOR domain-containing protein [Pseudoduganella plicata]|uniref:SPOR domain-containing protein n=1 Tax=Pseudoduganella plicata TaxID=321984 RepID=A0A4P7BFD2_9BURK|nr:SPOR domain-containing protein [Pseudoduganella plicata]QBQ36255.1 SPOR domain-containing protein [Pseudoduganella plicata]GGY76552.1 hypothetical protein GCM10007388_06610 [Pseudoduganella plicata]